MKRKMLAFIFVLTSLFGGVSGFATDADILAQLGSTQYCGYTALRIIRNNPPVEGLKEYALAILQKGDENTLAVFIRDRAQWKLEFVNGNAFYKGTDLPQISIEDHSNEITIAYPQGSKKESYVFRTNERMASISWLLTRYYADIMRDQASVPWNCFYDEVQEIWGTSTYEPTETNTYRGDIARDLSQFDIVKTPRSNEEMSRLLTHISRTLLDDESSNYDGNDMVGLR